MERTLAFLEHAFIFRHEGKTKTHQKLLHDKRPPAGGYVPPKQNASEPEITPSAFEKNKVAPGENHLRGGNLQTDSCIANS
jgi:hypothetical protein